VIFLEGSEEFIRQKIKELPEEIISGSHWTEEVLNFLGNFHFFFFKKREEMKKNKFFNNFSLIKLFSLFSKLNYSNI
jgi:hypothetical protein